MRKLIKGTAVLAILSLAILLTGNLGEAEAPTLEKAIVTTPSPTPTATRTTVPTKAPRVIPKATAKPVIVYVKKSTPSPTLTASGSLVADCIIDAFNPDNETERNRLITAARYTNPPCDYGFLFCIQDQTNCSGTVADCYKKYENGEICENMPPEIPFPQ